MIDKEHIDQFHQRGYTAIPNFFTPRETAALQAEVERFQKACAKAGAELVALDENPIDTIWASQPPMPIAPIEALDIRYAGESSEDKRARMGKKVEVHGVSSSRGFPVLGPRGRL